MGLTSKSRYHDLFFGIGRTSSSYMGKENYSFMYNFTGRAYQWVASQGHAWPFKKRKGRLARLIARTQDIGGGFLTQFNIVDHRPADVNWDTKDIVAGSASWKYNGKVFAYYTNMSATKLACSSNAQLDAWGATGISRSSPTNPAAGMGQFLGELRDLPTIPYVHWRQKAASGLALARRHSSEYLNVQFGWVPFIKDIMDCVKVYNEHDKRAQQYVKGSGKIHHRKCTIIDTSSTVTSTISATSYGYPVGVSYLYKTPGTLILNVTTKHKVWFSGAFTYYVDPGKDLQGRIRRAEQIYSRLYGLRVTPHLLWQLAPWSWAVDWMANVGDNIRNLSNFINDGLCMKYGYVMETITETSVYSLYGLTGVDGKAIYPSSTYTRTVKTRRRATPFGFGLNPTTFTGRQWSIIAALGISRSPRSLDF